MSYFHEYNSTDANVCNNCEHFEMSGDRYHCKSSGDYSSKMKKLDETTMECPELDVRAKAGLDSKKKGGGIGSKIADATVGKAKRELKAAAMRDVKTIGQNLGKLI